MLTLISYWGPPSVDQGGPRDAPNAIPVPVWTNPVHVRSKQPVDLYEST